MRGVGDLVRTAAVEADGRQRRAPCPSSYMPEPGSLMSITEDTAKRRMHDCSSGLSNHSCAARRPLAFIVSESGTRPASISSGNSIILPFHRRSPVSRSSAGRKSESMSTRWYSSVCGDLAELEPGLGVPLREAGDLLRRALPRGIVLLAVNRQAVLFVLEHEPVAAGVLVPLRAVVPELREVAPDRRVVPGQDDVGVRVAAEAGGRHLLGGQAAADLVPPLEDADRHAAVLDQVQRQAAAPCCRRRRSRHRTSCPPS